MAGRLTMARIVTLVLFAVWAVLVLYGVYAWQTTEATGSGFTRGFNRVSVFFQWQGIALTAAVIAWFTARGLPRGGSARRLGKAPLVLSGGFFILVVMLYVGAVIWARLAG